VREVGPIGFSSVSIVADDGTELLDISLIGVEPGKPGELPVTAGNGLMRNSAYEAIIDRNVARVIALQPGDWLTISSIQGNDKEFYTLQVVGVSDSLRYSLNPSVFVPIVTWDEIRPKAVAIPGADEPACNVVAVQLEDPTQLRAMQQLLQARVSDVEAVALRTAYESLPGYSSIRSSLSTQRTFALLIGMLVIGGFFQIQTLQKVPQIGTLKAIGTPNTVVALAAIVQIVMITLLGVVIGSVVSWGLSLMLPPNVPILFELRSGAVAVASIVLMGLIGGLVSIRQSLRVEPLIALGLGS
jgi:putative ABC transport system permease protein